MRSRIFSAIFVFALLVSAIAVFAQQKPTTPALPNAPASNLQELQQQKAETPERSNAPQTPRAEVRSELAKTSREAAGEEENAQFKQSPSVKFIAKHTGLSLKSAYWLSIGLNFAILAGLIVAVSKSKLPAMFRTRTGEIQRGITEARKASDDANRRLSDIEARLAKLDTEVAAMRGLAEQEASLEEARMNQGAEEEKKRIVEGAESEIAAAAKMARRELKSYAAELAVSLAEKRIHVDAETDHALVGNFVAQLTNSGGPGEDGH
jgi:F-type H+-transporting ATPase subunit b